VEKTQSSHLATMKVGDSCKLKPRLTYKELSDPGVKTVIQRLKNICSPSNNQGKNQTVGDTTSKPIPKFELLTTHEKILKKDCNAKNCQKIFLKKLILTNMDTT